MKKTAKKKPASKPRASFWRGVIDRAYKLPRGKSVRLAIPEGHQPRNIRAAASWAAMASKRPVSVSIIGRFAYISRKP